MLYFLSYPSSSLTYSHHQWPDSKHLEQNEEIHFHRYKGQTPSSTHVIQCRIRVRPGYLIKRVRPTWPGQNVTRLTWMTLPSFNPDTYECITLPSVWWLTLIRSFNIIKTDYMAILSPCTQQSMSGAEPTIYFELCMQLSSSSLLLASYVCNNHKWYKISVSPLLHILITFCTAFSSSLGG